MDAARFALFKRALAEALELEAGERSAFLGRLEEADPALAAEVRSCLDREGRAAGILDSTAAARWLSETGSAGTSPGGSAAAGEESSASDPERIGRYEIRGRLGFGGMGRVYLAYQSEPVSRDVALKLLRPERGGPGFLARFAHERKNLSLMEHPNIARILDAGEDDEGRPFLVMDLVRGVPLTDYCRSKSLGLESRVRLYLRVCQAVQHAHQKGVIHRDLKPSNILVEEHDGRPEPKIIDFGIAKMGLSSNTEPGPARPDGSAEQDSPVAHASTPLGPQPDSSPFHEAERELDSDPDAHRLTRVGQLLGTLDYMSPEQARGDADAVDARSDVFQLGVTLHEILTDRHPFFEPDLPFEDKLAAVLTPRVRALGATAPHPLKTDHDLLWIVRKALASDPEQRYASAASLAEDLERWLVRQPVSAHPSGSAYRLRRWLARNPVLSAALLGVFLFLGVFSTTVTRMFQVQRRETQRAETALRRAEQAQDFLLQTLSAADPETGDPDLSVRDAVDLAASSLPDGGETDQELSMRIQWTLGDFYHQLSRWDDAVESYERAWRDARSHFGAESPEAAEAMARLAGGLLQLDEGARADSLARASLRIRRDRLGPTHPLAGRSELVLGTVLTEQAAFPDAEVRLRRALQIFEDHDVLEEARNVEVLSRLAFVCERQGRVDEAERLVLRSIQIREELLGQDHVSVAMRDMHNLAYLQSATGEHELAAETFSRVLEVQLEHFGLEHASTAVTLENLAKQKYRVQEPAVAESLMVVSVEVARALSPGGGRFLADRLANFGYVLYGVGKPEEALVPIQESLELRKGTTFEDHPSSAAALSNAGDASLALDDPRAALGHFQEAREMMDRVAARPYMISRADLKLAIAHAFCGEWKKARELAAGCVASFAESPGPESTEWRVANGHLALSEHLAGNFERADDGYRAALASHTLPAAYALPNRARFAALALDWAAVRPTDLDSLALEFEQLRREIAGSTALLQRLRAGFEIYAANCELMRGETEAAERFLQEARERVPDGYRGRESLIARIDHLEGLLHLRRGQTSRAMAAFDRSRAQVLRRDAALIGFDWALAEASDFYAALGGAMNTEVGEEPASASVSSRERLWKDLALVYRERILRQPQRTRINRVAETDPGVRARNQ